MFGIARKRKRGVGEGEEGVGCGCKVRFGLKRRVFSSADVDC